MADRAHYIIFHPEKQRKKTAVKAIALVNNCIVPKWTGDIWCDKIGNGNEDPFNFNDPWLYSYCHASQLKRNKRKDCFLQEGSIIIFASGQYVDKGMLSVDTVFLVGEVHKWTSKPKLQLPALFIKHFRNNSSDLWTRHFKYPFSKFKSHDSVTHTYLAELWQKNRASFTNATKTVI